MKEIINKLPLIGAILLALSFASYTSNVEYEDLEKITVVVHDGPRELARKGSRYFLIETNNTSCKFEILGNLNREKKLQLLELRRGDLIEIDVLRSEAGKLTSPNCIIEIYGLKFGDQQILDARKLTGSGSYKVFLILGILILLAALGIWIVKS